MDLGMDDWEEDTRLYDDYTDEQNELEEEEYE